MKEASARVLLDRTMIRLDGRSFFSFGVRLFLTPPSQIDSVMKKIAAAGFTTVSTPPASPGNILTLNAIFEAAGKYDLLVILTSDPRVLEPGTFMAGEFSHQRSLHSYCILLRDGSEGEFLRFCKERDRLRHQDLFHPIWTPYQDAYLPRRYIDSTDLHSVSHQLAIQDESSPSGDGMKQIKTLFEECRSYRVMGRPFFCHSLETNTSDLLRDSGVYNFDAQVREHPNKMMDWYPWYAGLSAESRWDNLGPDSELIRIRCFQMLASRARGIITGTYDFFEGSPPYSGQDRFHELSIIAREIQCLQDFFSEGQYVSGNLETGHPSLKASMLHHTDDILVLLWRSGKGDEYWIDPTPMARAEIYLDISAAEDLTAWILDFPEVKQIPIHRDAKGAVNLQIDNFDLTGKILLTRSSNRSSEIAGKVESVLEQAVRSRKIALDVRQRKITLIESELTKNSYGVAQKRELNLARELIRESDNLIRIEEYSNAWYRLQEAAIQQRHIINRQMVHVVGYELHETGNDRLEMMRRIYYTLPHYYREINQRDEGILMEYT